MKLFRLFILSLLCSVNFYGNSQDDSLLTGLGYYEKMEAENNSLADTVLIKTLYKRINVLAYSDPKKANLYAVSAYRLSKKIGYKKGIARGLRLIGDTKMIADDLDSAILYIDKSISYARKHNLAVEQMEGYVARGNGHFYKGNYNEALDMYFSAAEISEISYETELAGHYGSIGLVFRVLGNDDKAEEYLEKGYQMANLYKDTADLKFFHFLS